MARTLVAILLAALPALAQVESLPPPVPHAYSLEILSNSRYSVHSGFTSSLSNQVLSNVLWAMSKSPGFGSTYREIYVATPANVYLYDPQGHVLNVHLSGNHRYSSNSAFEVGIAVQRHEEAGLAIQAGLIAATAFWTKSGCTNGHCPMAFAANYANSNWNPAHTINMVDVFGARTGTGLTDSLIARSTDSTLPRPATDAADTFEVALAGLRQDSLFDPAPLPLDDASQLLWAGFGVTPHMTTNGRRGLTIPSAVANYYLTRKIYYVADTAVMRYNNRIPPGTSLTTADHRLERVTSGDKRAALRTALPRLPSTAPGYIVLTVGDTANGWYTIEAGFAAFQYLMQANILGLGGWLTTPLTPAERTAIQTALGIPSADYPVIIFSTGQLLTGASEQPAMNLALPVRASSGPPVRIEYTLPQAAQVRFTITDLCGRQVAAWTESRAAGPQVTTWPAEVPAGIYFCHVAAGELAADLRLGVVR